MKMSMACRVCRKPLEQIEAINKINTRKPLRPRPEDPRNMQETKESATTRVQHLDPHPVSTKCGHVFHIGCIKKLISERASCRIPCPTCAKPVILAQLRGIKFFYPTNCDSMSVKIRQMNQENDTLTKELSEVRKLRAHKKYEGEVIAAKMVEVKQKAEKRDVEFKNKQKQLNRINFEGLTPAQMIVDLQETRKRIMELYGKNSDLLQHLESIASQLDYDEHKCSHWSVDDGDRQNLNMIMTTNYSHHILRDDEDETDKTLHFLPISEISEEDRIGGHWLRPCEDNYDDYNNKLLARKQRSTRDSFFGLDDTIVSNNYYCRNQFVRSTEKKIPLVSTSPIKEDRRYYLTSKYAAQHRKQNGGGDDDEHHQVYKVDSKLSRSISKFSETESNVSLDKMVMLPPGIFGNKEPPMLETCTTNVTRTREKKKRERKVRKKRVTSRGMKHYTHF